MKKNLTNLLMAALSLCLFACQDKADENMLSEAHDRVIENPLKIKEYLSNLKLAPGTRSANEGELADDGVPLPIGEAVVTDKKPDIVDGVPGVWITTTRDYKMSSSFDETILMDPTIDILYPGCVIKGGTINNGTYAAITDAKVGAIKFSISKIGDNATEPSLLTAEIKNIRLSDYRQKFHEWSKLNYKPGAVTAMHSVDLVNSKEEVALKLGASFKHKLVDISGKFNFKYDNGNNHILAKFIQKQFSVTMDMPKTPTIFEEIDTKLFKDYMPVYLSNINYGRIAILAVDTKHSLIDIETALELAVKKVNVGADLSSKYKKVLEESHISVLCIGGGAEEHNSVLLNGWEGFKKFMTTDIPMEKMSPISFQMRFAADNSLARTVLNSTYKVVKKEFIPEFDQLSIEMQVTGLKGDAGITETGNDLEIYGKIWVKPDKGEEVYIFNKAAANYISVRKGNDFVDVSSATAKKTITLKKPENIDFDQFVRTPVRIYAHFYDNDSPAKDKDYGESYVEYTVKDLIEIQRNKNDRSFEVRNDGFNNKVHARVKVVDVYYSKKK